MSSAFTKGEEREPLVMDRGGDDGGHYEDTPAYEALKNGGVLTAKYRRKNVEVLTAFLFVLWMSLTVASVYPRHPQDIFTGKDVKANASQASNMKTRCLSGSCAAKNGLVFLSEFCLGCGTNNKTSLLFHPWKRAKGRRAESNRSRRKHRRVPRCDADRCQ